MQATPSTIAPSTQSAATAPASDAPSSAPAQPSFAVAADPIIRDFLNPALTLADIAARCQTPVMTLVEYTQKPYFQQIIRTILEAARARAALLAEAGLHAVVSTQYQAIEEASRLAAAQPINHATTPAQLTARARISERARKAAATLLKLARPPRPNRAPQLITAPITTKDTPNLPQSIPRAA